MKTNGHLNYAIFFCQKLDPSQDTNRRALEKELGSHIRFFPMPCTGRVEALHLMRALESGADKVYVVTCASSTCRYREGNARAKKRLEFAQGLIEEIGLERERLEILPAPSAPPISVDTMARELMNRATGLSPSPLR